MAKKLPFVLTCRYCEPMDVFKSKHEAIAAGWIEIDRDVTGTSWNDIGFCPECQLTDARNTAVSMAKSAWLWINPAEKRCHDANKKWCKEGRDAKRIYKRLCEVGKEIQDAEHNVEKLKAHRKAANVELVTTEELVEKTPVLGREPAGV